MINDIVIALVDLYHKNGSLIPAYTLGRVVGCTGAGLLQVDFGPTYGPPKFVGPAWVEVIDSPGVGESVGESLIALVVKQGQEIKRLRRVVAAQENNRAKPRLASRN